MQTPLRNYNNRARLRKKVANYDEVIANLAPHLKLGNAFLSNVNLYGLDMKLTQTPIPELVGGKSWTNCPLIAPAGSLLMYAGNIRIAQMNAGREVRLIRHTFILGTGKYIIKNLLWLKPVVEE